MRWLKSAVVFGRWIQFVVSTSHSVFVCRALVASPGVPASCTHVRLPWASYSNVWVSTRHVAPPSHVDTSVRVTFTHVTPGNVFEVCSVCVVRVNSALVLLR